MSETTKPTNFGPLHMMRRFRYLHQGDPDISKKIIFEDQQSVINYTQEKKGNINPQEDIFPLEMDGMLVVLISAGLNDMDSKKETTSVNVLNDLNSLLFIYRQALDKDGNINEEWFKNYSLLLIKRQVWTNFVQTYYPDVWEQARTYTQFDASKITNQSLVSARKLKTDTSPTVPAQTKDSSAKV